MRAFQPLRVIPSHQLTYGLAVAKSRQRSPTLGKCSHPLTANTLLASRSCMPLQTALGYASNWFPAATTATLCHIAQAYHC
jgi:hypothetical protein